MASPLPTRPPADLSTVERERLEKVHRRLREAVAAYEPFLGRELRPGEDVPAHDPDAMLRAQEDVEAAEDELWRLREEILGWARPPGTLRATQVTDWFSEADRVYDDVDGALGH